MYQIQHGTVGVMEEVGDEWFPGATKWEVCVAKELETSDARRGLTRSKDILAYSL